MPTQTKVPLSSQDLNTLRAALRFYDDAGMGEPALRSDEIHEIATNNDEDISLDSAAIEDLFARLGKELGSM